MSKTSIWWRQPDLEHLNSMNEGTMGEALGMEFTNIGSDFLSIRMPVDERTKQPAGLLHGGASASLAETAGSVASYLCVDPELFQVVGVELNCSHLRSARQGYVTATCRPVRIGRSMHVWSIDIHDQAEKLVCVCRLTVTVLNKIR
jgi:1,4-dihydroxy-2-naphthoyl-CoA hydrolase